MGISCGPWWATQEAPRVIDLWTSPGPFTVAELAGTCRVSSRFLHKLIEADVLPACRVGPVPEPGVKDRRPIRIQASVARAFALQAGVEPG
jgi:hypothetical protein